MGRERLEVKLFKALAHPIRLQVVKSLLDKDLCVCEINECVTFSQSNLSQHLKILKEAGIVESSKDGLKVNYHISHPKIEELLQLADVIIQEIVDDML